MKTRSGFVSNSSSSSFIVENYEQYPLFGDNTPKLSKEEIDKLLDYGFFYVRRKYASELENSMGKAKPCKKPYNLGYWIMCNQDEVIDFLLKNNIPFTAVINYGHTHVFYDRDSTDMLVAENYGLSLEMYGHKAEHSIPLPSGTNGVRKVDVNKYLEGKEWV